MKEKRYNQFMGFREELIRKRTGVVVRPTLSLSFSIGKFKAVLANREKYSKKELALELDLFVNSEGC